MKPEKGMEALRKIISKKNRPLLLAVLAAVAVALILISDPSPSESNTPVRIQTEDMAEYVTRLEQRVAEMVASIDGAGSAKVMITLESGTEYVYALDGKTTNDSSATYGESGTKSEGERIQDEQSIIVIDGENGKQALLRTTLEPTVNGVVILCTGGGREDVRERVVNAVTIALGVSSRRVCVTKLSK